MSLKVLDGKAFDSIVDALADTTRKRKCCSERSGFKGERVSV